MPTVKEANRQRKSYAWMISMIMEEKERLARQRLNEITAAQPSLKKRYEEYLRLYDLHIKPMMHDVDHYIANEFEKRKIEHFLQGQADHRQGERDIPKPKSGQRHWSLPPQIEKLPYADKSQVGKKPRKEKALTEDDAKEYIRQLKALDPQEFAALLKQIGG